MPDSSRVDVEDHVELRLLITDADAVSIPVALKYSKEDPYAVTVAFGGDGLSVQWVFGRELLTEGQKASVGMGDVRVWPGARRDDDTLFISLSSPDGQAVLQAKIADVRSFLNRTYEVVRPGEESSHVDLDASLSYLLP